MRRNPWDDDSDTSPFVSTSHIKRVSVAKEWLKHLMFPSLLVYLSLCLLTTDRLNRPVMEISRVIQTDPFLDTTIEQIEPTTQDDQDILREKVSLIVPSPCCLDPLN